MLARVRVACAGRFDDLKHSSSRERIDLDDRVRALEQRLVHVESLHRTAQLEFEHALKVKQSELTSATHALRSAQAQVAESSPDVLKQLEYLKDDLSDLATSESMYVEFKAIEPHRQTVREYVCCAVYELVRAERNNKEAMAKELEMIRVKFIQSEDEAERNARERDTIAKLKKQSANNAHTCCRSTGANTKCHATLIFPVPASVCVFLLVAKPSCSPICLTSKLSTQSCTTS